MGYRILDLIDREREVVTIACVVVVALALWWRS